MDASRSERFESMFRENYPAVRGYAMRRTSGDAAQDVVAETFLVAWRRFDELPDNVLPWLFGVARRVLANQRRSAGRSVALEQRLQSERGPGASDDAARVADAEIVRAALARLSERDRETLILVGWDGLSGARAARAAGCTRGAFAVRLHRARARLATELSALDSGTGPAEPQGAGAAS